VPLPSSSKLSSDHIIIKCGTEKVPLPHSRTPSHGWKSLHPVLQGMWPLKYRRPGRGWKPLHSVLHEMLLWHMGRFYNNTGISSLLGNDSINILAATNTDNNSEFIFISRCYAITLVNKDRRGILCGPCWQHPAGQWTTWIEITWHPQNYDVTQQ
jgi:hypothetical protein